MTLIGRDVSHCEGGLVPGETQCLMRWQCRRYLSWVEREHRGDVEIFVTPHLCITDEHEMRIPTDGGPS